MMREDILLQWWGLNSSSLLKKKKELKSANEVAKTRIARAIQAGKEKKDETEDEDKDETVEVGEPVTEETVESTSEEEDDGAIELELDESFISDLVGSDEFGTAIRSIVTSIVATAVKDIDTKLRSLETTVAESSEWQNDIPTRTKRAVVSYRPRNTDGVVETAGETEQENRTYESVAEESLNDIFGD